MLAYVAATTTRDSTARFVYLFAMAGFLLPAFPPKAVQKKPFAQLHNVVITPAASSPPVPGADYVDVPTSVSVKYTANGCTTQYQFRVRKMSRHDCDRAQELLFFLKRTDLFNTSYWTQKQFLEDVFYALEIAARPEFQKEKRSFSVRRKLWVQAMQKNMTFTGRSVSRAAYLREILCVDDLLRTKLDGASSDFLQALVRQSLAKAVPMLTKGTVGSATPAHARCLLVLSPKQALRT